ncbi:MAG: hypothetical protein IJ806_04650 [Ruminococcus sp.]|nr:hypothetical protein [Ruminococcus sp.]
MKVRYMAALLWCVIMLTGCGSRIEENSGVISEAEVSSLSHGEQTETAVPGRNGTAENSSVSVPSETGSGSDSVAEDSQCDSYPDDGDHPLPDLETAFGALSDLSDSLAGDSPQLLSSPEEVGLYDTDGGGSRYAFTYGGETYSAVYTYDNWKVIDSYRITNSADIELICTALSDEHPIHDRELTGYRTPEDMAYEWEQHNIAYRMLNENSSWLQNVKDVDLDPADQGKSLYDLFRDRMGV